MRELIVEGRTRGGLLREVGHLLFEPRDAGGEVVVLHGPIIRTSVFTDKMGRLATFSAWVELPPVSPYLGPN